MWSEPTVVSVVLPFCLLAIAYLFGSLSFAVMISQLIKAPDPRLYGSGNPGATNMLRGGRKWAALCTLLGDGAKGWIVVKLALFCQTDIWIVAGCAVCVLLGHIYPLFFCFKGGKGVATALGILLALSPTLAFIATGVWTVIMVVKRFSSLAAIGATLAVLVASYWLWDMTHPYFMAVSLIATLVLYRHRTNIADLLAKRERPIN
ncbi:MAG: glycerol-3-phosphate 1-O-acyltransferase PlsY [Neisseriales bacterium]|nr:MAG: glycerol-3-phosphate 1-O-acyltransferase PlsY [Neisseriales bacterium]